VWRARVVTYGLLLVLAFGVWNHVEAWPVTSYRLFSGLRTASASSWVLVAVESDGDLAPVRLRGDTIATTAHQFGDLVDMDEDARRERVGEWLELAGMDPGTVEVVRLDRVTLRLDPDGGPPVETGRRTVVEIVP
jgi:hypothetical protein